MNVAPPPLGFGLYGPAPLDELPREYVIYVLETPKYRAQLSEQQLRYLIRRVLGWIGVEVTAYRIINPST